ncbi:hypothetical protein ISN44_As12g032360 [Arabidopsis suecica]|uniref:Uncharacterized protein n=1 Tax=Arabidopsis suecica TaxID=45249 RepID=A0A8T1YQ02_ARASU|nr:hypothetical protein ISN44_As12g032360 [Arabidopsis suecica]
MNDVLQTRFVHLFTNKTPSDRDDVQLLLNLISSFTDFKSCHLLFLEAIFDACSYGLIYVDMEMRKLVVHIKFCSWHKLLGEMTTWLSEFGGCACMVVNSKMK